MNQSWSTSPSLIQRVQSHDAKAWQQLCDIYAPLVYSWVRKANVEGASAEDLVQETFLAVFSGIKRFRRDRPEHSFRGWLLTVTRNEIRAWYRRLEKQVAVGEGGTEAQARIHQVVAWVESDDDSNAILNDPTVEQELLRRAANLIQQDFESKTWQAFWRSTVDGLPTRDIAEDLQMTTVAVRQAKFRVLARLREVLE